MKATDLMIGDIVFLNGRAMHVTLAMLNTWNDNIRPISLTPETLEKNFQKSELFDYERPVYELDRQRLYAEIDYDNDIALSTSYIDDELRHQTTVICYIKYVHELQHALKLCGIEKEIII